jgi:hypothetical protein
VAAYQGEIVEASSHPGASCFTVRGTLPDDLAGQTFFAVDDQGRRAYPIVSVERADGLTRVFTKRDSRGFEARPAQRYEIPTTAVFTMSEE